jgi:conjugative relaxase-like TrwC/TraI family protein
LQEEQAERAFWTGIAAEYLGIAGREVRPEVVEALTMGVDPESGLVLRHRMQKRTMHDLIVAAPKAASIAAVMDDRIAQAHNESAELARQRIEWLARAHTREGGIDERHPTHNLVQAMYQHNWSRAFNPHLHTHILTVNLTYVESLREWRALDALPIYQQKYEIGEEYRHKLAGMLEGWGYKLEAHLVDADRYPRDGEKYPEEVGFGIAGITPEMEREFSQRAAQLEEADRIYYEREGKEMREAQRDRFIRISRESKGEQIGDPTIVRQRFMEKLKAEQREKLYRVRQEALERSEKMAPRRVRNGPWMAQTGGVEDFSYKHRESAWRSYQRWQHRGSYGFADYVNYVQDRWAENPGLLREWLSKSPSEREGMERREKLNSPGVYESPLKRQHWDYGEDASGVRMRL